MKKFVTGALVIASLSHGALAETTPEQVLADAARYTVKIEVLSRMGLNQDDGGSGLGTGFLIDRRRGWIVTNAHVSTRSPANIKVSFKGGEKIEAKRIHVDPLIDLAILEIAGADIPTDAREAQLDCGGEIQPGSSVFAYGHPWGLSFTASRGIVAGMSWFYPSHLIQTDAAINSGNSGGPLINISSGKVQGINTSNYKDRNDENATSVGLAEPIQPVCRIVDLLKQHRDTRLRQLPVALATSGDDLRPRVAHLYDQASGFLTGDIVTRVNGSKVIKDLPDLANSLRGIDNTASVTVERANQQLVIETRLRIAPDPLNARSINLSGLIISAPWRLDDQEQNQDNNLVVDWVDTEHDAGLTNATASDIIVSVDGKPYNKVEELYAYLASLPKNAKISMMLRSDSNSVTYFREYKHVELTNALLEWVSPDGRGI